MLIVLYIDRTLVISRGRDEGSTGYRGGEMTGLMSPSGTCDAHIRPSRPPAASAADAKRSHRRHL